MKEIKSHSNTPKIDGIKAITDYTRCIEISDCEKCECFKEVGFDNFNTLCDFLRTYTSYARSKIDKALDTIL